MALTRLGFASIATVAALVTGGAAPLAHAQDDINDDGELAGEGIEGNQFEEYERPGDSFEPKAEYGVGLLFRGVFVPEGLLELFVDDASSGVFHPGFGIQLVRRKLNFELVLGLEYEGVAPSDGFWLEKGDDPLVPGQTPDFVEFEGLSWFTADISFLFNSPINDKVSIRYGAGFGLGIVFGDAYQTDSVCTGRNVQDDCMPISGGGGQIRDPADLPPVFPVVNLLAGVQFKPTDKITINLEGGMRTLFFFGLSSNYYF